MASTAVPPPAPASPPAKSLLHGTALDKTGLPPAPNSPPATERRQFGGTCAGDATWTLGSPGLSSATGVVDDDELDGFSADEIFGRSAAMGAGPAAVIGSRTGYTYDDLILLPGHIGFGVGDVDLETRLTKRIALKAPIVSSPMDTVTESRMAIQMALFGGIGIVHYNMPVEVQAEEVRKVKKFKNGFITDPVSLPPSASVADVDAVKARCGFCGIPITENGRVGSKLLGFISNRDIDFVIERASTLVTAVMTPLEHLVTATEPLTLSEANLVLQASSRLFCSVPLPLPHKTHLNFRTEERATAIGPSRSLWGVCPALPPSREDVRLERGASESHTAGAAIG